MGVVIQLPRTLLRPVEDMAPITVEGREEFDVCRDLRDGKILGGILVRWVYVPPQRLFTGFSEHAVPTRHIYLFASSKKANDRAVIRSLGRPADIRLHLSDIARLIAYGVQSPRLRSQERVYLAYVSTEAKPLCADDLIPFRWQLSPSGECLILASEELQEEERWGPNVMIFSALSVPKAGS